MHSQAMTRSPYGTQTVRMLRISLVIPTMGLGSVPRSSPVRGAVLIVALLLGLGGCGSSQTVALVGGTVFTDPDAVPLEDAIVLLESERIAAVGPRAETPIPRNARVVDVTGKSIMAGFWNAHVHFTGPQWEGAASRDADALSIALEDMLLRWGFVRVVDTGSFLQNTLALRERIQNGEVTGPEIWTTGLPFAPPNGNPFYIEPIQAPVLSSPSQARESVAAHFAAGADLLKVFSGAPVAPGRTVLIPEDALSAASATTHALDRLVIAHPTTNDGIRRAIEGGVDILAHTTPDGGEPWDSQLVAAMREADLSVVPTLTLWKWSVEQQGGSEDAASRLVALAQAQLVAYANEGGSVLFGTDVGFISEYDPTREYLLLSEAGLGFPEILRALTTEPSRRFTTDETGTVSQGATADLVIVNGRPDRDVGAFADVSAVYLRGDQVLER